MTAPKINALLAQLDDGGVRAATQEEIVDIAREYLSARYRRGTTLKSPSETRDFLTLKLGHLDHEVFAVIYLDTKNRIIDYQVMFRGTIDGVAVHPREVVKEALKLDAASVILAHPRPTGVAEPSPIDTQICQRLKKALDLLDIRILDHMVIAGGQAVSFAELGRI